MKFYGTTGAWRSIRSRRRIRLAVLCALAIALILSVVVTAQSQGTNAVTVTVIADGQTWEYTSGKDTIGGVLAEAGVELGASDRVCPKPETKPFEGMKIRVTRVTDRVVVQEESIAFKTVMRFNPHLRGGTVVLQQGKPGKKELTYLVTYKDGVKVGCKLLEARVLNQPEDRIVAVSRSAELASRGGVPLRIMRMAATAYDPGPRSCGKWASGRTAIGMKAGYGVVAVDPRVVPLGTRLYVEGYGYCVAGDTGSAIKGNRIDLGFGTYREAIRFGRRQVTVYVLD